MGKRCYYDNDKCSYAGGLWQCKTCGEWFCYNHAHATTEGVCVECVACERLRKGDEEEDNNA